MPRARSPRRTLKSSLWRLAFLMTLFALGFSIGVVGPWIWWLDQEAGQRFADRQWTQASRVYARPLELYPGRLIDLKRLSRELEAIGVRRGDPTAMGRYRILSNRLEAHVPAFVFGDDRQPAQQIVVRVEQGVVSGLETNHDKSVALVRLPPAELGSLLPLNDRDRTLVALEDFPPLLIAGIQAVEDRQFAHHFGVDPRGLARAAWANLRRGAVVQGGSTITQQLVKNLFLTPERSLWRKFNEAIMAMSLERRFGKAAILEAYLNEVYLGQAGGHAIHGFGRAAEHYFGLPVQSLNTEQIALLVGMVRGASWYHPRRNAERARARRDRVIDMFYETRLIGETEWQRARSSALGLGSPRPGGGRRHDGFLDLVTRQLRRDYRDRDLRGTGLRVFTTLDPIAQIDAERALSEGLSGAERNEGELQGAVVLIEPASGEIRALVGDRTPGRFGFNRALDARRPIGSVIKPFIYLLALAQPDRWHLASTLVDRPLSVPVEGQPPWQPENIDGESHGEVALMDALARSFNQATVALGLEVGLPALFRLLDQLGVAKPEAAHPSAFLGAIELTPLQLAQLYQPLAAEGYSTPVRAINQVLDRDGNEIGRYGRRLRPVREREALALLDFGLRHAVTDGTGRSWSWRLPDDPGVRGKTGTSNDRRDAWFVGYTDHWLGVVWAGRDDNAPAGVSGSGTALPIWAELFKQLPLDTVRRNWPEGIEWYWIDWPAPLLASEECPNALAVPFIEGSQPDSRSQCMTETDEQRRRWFRRR